MSRIVAFTAPHTVGFNEIADPILKPNEVRIKTLFSGISRGTEMTVYRGGSSFFSKHYDSVTRLFLANDTPDWSYPISFGYENVGEVVEIGSEVSRLKLGDIAFTYMP